MHPTPNLKLLLSLFIATVCYSQNLTVKTVSTDYTVVQTDFNKILVFTDYNTAKSFKLTVPPFTLKQDIGITGGRIYGTAMTDGEVTILPGHADVIIISPNNVNKTKDFGAYWQLIYLGKNIWVLNGDLYSTIVEAYIGDRVFIKAKIDSKATGPFTFTWFKNGQLLSNQTKATIEISNATAQDAGQYQVYVKNSSGFAKSEITTLIIK